MKKTLIAVFIMVLSVFMPNATSAGEIAIIINKENIINDISYNDLVKIFKQERQYWHSGKKIYLVMREAGDLQKKMVLKKIYKMDDEELKKLWLAKLFRGEISSFPKSLGSDEAAKRFVSQVPNAVSFIASESLDDSVKVLRIDGRLPKDKGYILAGESENEN